MKRMASVLLLLVSLILALPRPAVADTLDQVLSILHSAGLVDGAVVEGKPLIQCLIDGGSLGQCEAKLPKPAVGSPLSGADPKVRLVVDIIRAAKGGRWLEVLELTGTDLLLQVACQAGLPVSGPVQNFVCGGLFAKVAQQAKPVVRRVLVAVGSGNLDDWLAVAALVGPELACQLVPGDVPGRDAICSTLSKVLVAAIDTAKAAVEAVWGTINNIGDWITGQSKHMPVDTYYALNWQPWYQYAVKVRLGAGGDWNGLMGHLWDPCVEYFDSHTMSADNARKTCDRLRSRFSTETETFEQVLQLGGNAHQQTVAEPFAEIFAVTDIGMESAIPAHRRLVEMTCETELRKRLPFPAPDPGRCPRILEAKGHFPPMFGELFNKLHQRCVSDQTLQSAEPSAYNKVCGQVGAHFQTSLLDRAGRVEAGRRQLLMSGHCRAPADWKRRDGLVLTCTDWRAHQQCMTLAAAAHPGKRCTFDRADSDSRLAGQLIQALGGRARCGRQGGKIVCTRPWKLPQCQALLAAARQQGEYADTPLSCTYQETTEFKAAKVRAKEILDALNAPLPAPDGGGRMQVRKPPALAAALNNCRFEEDPLAILCADAGRYVELSQRLPGAQLPICLPDPQHNGSDVPCWGGPVTLPDQIRPPKGSIDPRTPQPIIRQSRIEISDRVRIADTTGTWETTVTISSRGLQRLRGGLCRVPVRVDLHNAGALTASGKRLNLRIGDHEAEAVIPDLKKGASQTLDLSIGAAAGQRRLVATVRGADGSEGSSRTLSLRIEASCD